jgi:hypothetical protein
LPHPFLLSLQHLSNHLHGGVVWEPSTLQNRQPPQHSQSQGHNGIVGRSVCLS